MKIHFKYSIAKEIENLRIGLKSLNHFGKLPKIMEQIKQSDIDINDENQVAKFFEEQIDRSKIDIDQYIRKIEHNWLKIEPEVEKILNNLFSTNSDLGDITVYLTLNDRCSYNYKKRYFFVNLTQNTNYTIVHELMHFYTDENCQEEFKKHQIDYEQYIDFKEALTFLINICFAELLNGYINDGYAKQAKLRTFLEQKWPACENVNDLVGLVIGGYFKQDKKQVQKSS